MYSIFFLILKTILQGKSTLFFLSGVILSFAFSIAVILSTIGIMDGFEKSLKSGLKKSSGEIKLYNRYGFFNFEEELRPLFEKFELGEVSAQLQVEGFLVQDESAKGIILKGIDPQNHSQVIGLNLNSLDQEGPQVIVGTQLAKELKLEVGTTVTLALNQGNESFSGRPNLLPVTIVKIIEHGVFEKDLRLVYVHQNFLRQAMNIPEVVNFVDFNLPLASQNSALEDPLSAIEFLNFQLPEGFIMRPYWSEFSHLLEAVEIEKITISLILQIIVVVSLFNILAFLFFLREQKSSSIFLLSCLGVPPRKLDRVWLFIVFSIWGLSCLVSLCMLVGFDYFLGQLTFLHLPPEIYAIEKLSLEIDQSEYSLIFSISLLWVFFIFLFGRWRIKKMGLMAGLRTQFQ